MRVLKFGGSSVADSEAITRVASIVARQPGATVVVVSALAGVTDALLVLANQAAAGRNAQPGLDALIQRHNGIAATISHPQRRRLVELSVSGFADSARATLRAISAEGRTQAPLLDKLVAVGELWSSRLVDAAVSDAGVESHWVDARGVVKTDGRHQSASPDFQATVQCLDRLVRPWLARQRVVVLGGFIGSGPDGAPTTLGRGGSDYSATILGACLAAEEIQIWTDVDGVLTADPRVVQDTQVLPVLSYESAHTLARFGAKILHPRTMEPAAARGIPVRVLNSFSPDAPGTRIGPAVAGGTAEASAVSSRADIALVEIRLDHAPIEAGAIARVFGELHDAGIAVILAELCDGRLALAVDAAADLEPLQRSLSGHATVQVTLGKSAVCVVAAPVAREARLVFDALTLLGTTPIHLMARPAGAATLGLVVDTADAGMVVKQLHDGIVARPYSPLVQGVA
ncbi:MAG: aspartate kinase [Vicinamibacterales bacterium]